MLQFPIDPPGPVYPPTAFEQFVSLFVLSMLLLTLVALCLPRPWFAALFKIAFPFMPERIEKNDQS